jgi:hypothetical protein
MRPAFPGGGSSRGCSPASPAPRHCGKNCRPATATGWVSVEQHTSRMSSRQRVRRSVWSEGALRGGLAKTRPAASLRQAAAQRTSAMRSGLPRGRRTFGVATVTESRPLGHARERRSKGGISASACGGRGGGVRSGGISASAFGGASEGVSDRAASPPVPVPVPVVGVDGDAVRQPLGECRWLAWKSRASRQRLHERLWWRAS